MDIDGCGEGHFVYCSGVRASVRDIEYREHAKHAGIDGFGRAAALGTDDAFVRCLADLVQDAVRTFDRYECVRCLMPKADVHRRRPSCPSCRFRFPAYLRDGAAVSR